MRFGGAGGRLVELGERKGGEQLAAPRALVLRDGDGGLEGFFPGREIDGVTLQQDVAAQTMKVRVAEMLCRLGGDRQPLVDEREAASGPRVIASSSASNP